MLLPRPGFPLCQVLCDYHGVEPRYYDLAPDRDWEIDLDSVAAAADERTCALVVNNPSNPCGSVFSAQHLKDVLSLAEELRLPVIADEVYTDMSFGDTYVSCASVSPNVPILAVSALSKRWVAPGWRMGWVTVHDAHGAFREGGVQDTLLKICQVTLGPAAPLQAAVPAIIGGGSAEDKWKTGVLGALEESAQYCIERCKSVPGLEVASNPQGTMYLMVRVRTDEYRDIDGAVEFAGALLQEESVAVLPGECFFYPGFIRVVFCASLDILEEAWDRIDAFCRRRHVG